MRGLDFIAEGMPLSLAAGLAYPILERLNGFSAPNPVTGLPSSFDMAL